MTTMEKRSPPAICASALATSELARRTLPAPMIVSGLPIFLENKSHSSCGRTLLQRRKIMMRRKMETCFPTALDSELLRRSGRHIGSQTEPHPWRALIADSLNLQRLEKENIHLQILVLGRRIALQI
jgi:hypothetical protein